MKASPTLNCDIGEGNDDAAILPWIDRASIACGGHTGDADTLARTLQLAKEHGVEVGPHPSYPDPVNFGRKSLTLPLPELEESLIGQINLFLAVATSLGQSATHIKAHGALYHDTASDPARAAVFLKVCRQMIPGGALLLPPFSLLEAMAGREGIRCQREIFADRAYNDEGQLQPRHLPGAVLWPPPVCLARLQRWQATGLMETSSGRCIPLPGDTICLHGDHPGAAGLARVLAEGLYPPPGYRGQ